MCLPRVGGDSSDFFLGPHHAHAKFVLEQRIGGSAPGIQTLGRQALEWHAGQPDVLEDGGHTIKGQYPAYCDQGVARSQGQQARKVGACAQSSAFQDRALTGAFAGLFAGIGLEAKKSVLNLLLGVGGHEGAFALAAYHQVVRGEFVDGLAYRSLADAKTRCEVHFAGDGFAGLPLARLQALEYQALDLLVQRAEGRRAGVSQDGCGIGRRGGIGCHRRLKK